MDFRGVFSEASLLESQSLNIDTFLGRSSFYLNTDVMCFFFPEVTSLASVPAKTPDSRAGVPAELLLCLLCLYHKLAHCTRYNVDNVSVSSLSTQGHKTLWTTTRRTWGSVGQKLNLTALKQAHRLPLRCFPSVIMMHPASVFLGCRCVSLFMFSSFEECLHGAFWSDTPLEG